MIIVLAMGLVFVLLLGEIDLSAGFAAGTCAAVLAVTLTQKQWPLALALLACIGTGVLIGLLIGLLVARLGIPSFVVTLAMFLALKCAGVPSDLHVFASGGYGFGLRASDKPCSTWPARCGEWLREQGWLSARK